METQNLFPRDNIVCEGKYSPKLSCPLKYLIFISSASLSVVIRKKKESLVPPIFLIKTSDVEEYLILVDCLAMVKLYTQRKLGTLLTLKENKHQRRRFAEESVRIL